MAKKDYEKLCYCTEMLETFKFLDRRDLKDFLKENSGNTISNLMHVMEDVYDSCLQLPKCCNGFLFNYLNEEEFFEYLHNKYGVIINGERKEKLRYIYDKE